MIIVAIESARLTNQDRYMAYIDFINVFKSIDYTRLSTIMEDLGYPKDTIS